MKLIPIILIAIGVLSRNSSAEEINFTENNARDTLLTLLHIVETSPTCALNVNSCKEVLQSLSEDVISDILTILSNGIVKTLGNCTIKPDASEVTYWLYTRQHEDYVQIRNVDILNNGKPIIFLVHGWGGNKSVNYINVIRDAYITRYDANIITVDYGAYVNSDYFSSYCNLPSVATNFATFLCDLNKIVSIKNVHVVSHSMGSQLSGLAGMSTQKICGNQLGRITGLDPAGPLYQNANEDSRLDPSDALFVDIIHTDEGKFGYAGNMGTVDFYPNCGQAQAGCKKNLLQSSSIEEFKTLSLDVIRCNHQRSCYLFAESINRNGFYSRSCVTCGGRVCDKELISPHHTYMGEACKSPQSKNMYILETASYAPFGLGPLHEPTEF